MIGKSFSMFLSFFFFFFFLGSGGCTRELLEEQLGEMGKEMSKWGSIP